MLPLMSKEATLEKDCLPSQLGCGKLQMRKGLKCTNLYIFIISHPQKIIGIDLSQNFFCQD